MKPCLDGGTNTKPDGPIRQTEANRLTVGAAEQSFEQARSRRMGFRSAGVDGKHASPLALVSVRRGCLTNSFPLALRFLRDSCTGERAPVGLLTPMHTLTSFPNSGLRWQTACAQVSVPDPQGAGMEISQDGTGRSRVSDQQELGCKWTAGRALSLKTPCAPRMTNANGRSSMSTRWRGCDMLVIVHSTLYKNSGPRVEAASNKISWPRVEAASTS